MTSRGTVFITGRSDGTLNRGGVRMGTAEYYAVVESLEGVTDSLVVHLEDPDGCVGELWLFVVAPGLTWSTGPLRGFPAMSSVTSSRRRTTRCCFVTKRCATSPTAQPSIFVNGAKSAPRQCGAVGREPFGLVG